MSIKRSTFKGGYTFKRFSGGSVPETTKCSYPEKVILPLQHSGFSEVLPLVKGGDVVKAGQIIGRDDEKLSTPVLSTVNGKVSGVKKVTISGKKTKAVIISGDGTFDWEAVKPWEGDWTSLSADKLEDHLYLSGAAAAGLYGLPTRFNSSKFSPEQVKEIIVYHDQTDIYNADPNYLLQDDREEAFLTGIAVLRHLYKKAGIHIAFSDNDLLEKIEGKADIPNTQFYSVKPKYPQGNETLLVSTILGITAVNGLIPDESGVLIFDIQSVLAISDAVTIGKPFIEKTLMLAGTGYKNPLYTTVRIGTPIESVVSGKLREGMKTRIILDSLLTGTTLEDTSYPVSSELNCIIALYEKDEGEMLYFAKPGLRKDSVTNTFLAALLPASKTCNTNLNGERRACLSCGFCSDKCPSGIMPEIIHPYVEREKIDETIIRFGIFRCIDCNLCSYVCPSKIPAAQILREGKRLLIKEGYLSDEKIVSRYRNDDENEG